MNSEGIVYLLEENWEQLRGELSDQWQDFTRRYDEIIARLPNDPESGDLDSTVDAVCELLSQSEYGRGLLHGFQIHGRERLVASGSTTLKDREQINQVCNRLRKLQEKSG
jgi:hypothetical protein